MINALKRGFAAIAGFFGYRILVLALLVAGMFALLFTKLYEIQIVHGQEYQESAKLTYNSTRTVTAPRGEIYDRNGQPLAINHSTVMVKLDTAIKAAADNDMLVSLIRLMSRFGELVIDDLPISASEPREFIFGGSPSKEKRWKTDMNVPQEATAQEAYELLLKTFKISTEDGEMTPEEIRLVLSLRQSIYLQRFSKNPVTVCMEVSDAACAALEERNQDYPGIYLDIDYVREYPYGEYAAHILGYTRKITAEQLDEMGPLGYTAEDIVGQSGLERSFELTLRGGNGSMKIETDTLGRRLSVVESTPASSGNNVFITVDIELQKQAYHILERQLAQILIGKLQIDSRKSGLKDEDYVTTKTMLSSMITAGTVSVTAIMTADESCLAWPLREFAQFYFDWDQSQEDYISNLKDFFAEALEKGRITENQLLLVMYEQGIVTPTEAELERLHKGTLPVQPFLVRMLSEGVITPQMTNIQPCTGSIVVLDLRDGGVLATVSYPSYDNNELVNNFNYNYYLQLLNDPTVPMFNRAFQEMRAVGSTFKMITAVTGLENGVISTSTTITDEFYYTKAGNPPAKCTARHGSPTVVEALGKSCNYFFYETAYRLGNTKSGNMRDGIDKLTEYMVYFGLGSATGVEISEVFDYQYDKLPEGTLPISSPDYKMYTKGLRWSDGDTIRTAIGQSENNLTCATMAKYAATLATGGVRYQMHFLDRIVAYNGTVVSQFTPVVEETVPMKESTINAVHKGMLAVTTSSYGTGSKIFKDFPIQVAGKTGTAQQTNWYNHTSFAGFAPYDNPQIAIYVLMPGSYQTTIASPAAVVARDVLAAYFRLDATPQQPEQVNALAR